MSFVKHVPITPSDTCFTHREWSPPVLLFALGPNEIGKPSVSTNTSSISLNWTAPPGEVFKYRLDWHNGGAPMTVYTDSLFAVLSGLIPGTRYTISVIAVAGDNQTKGNPHTFTSVTSNEMLIILHLTFLTLVAFWMCN